jgi:F-type H+-transporting ATPase subunit a
MDLFSPLDQFENIAVHHNQLEPTRLILGIFAYTETWLNLTSFFWGGIGIYLCGTFYFFLSAQVRVFFIPQNNFIFFEQYFLGSEQIIRDLVINARGKVLYYGLFLCLFSLLIVLNVTGLIPYTFAHTSYFIFTFVLSSIYFNSLNITGVYYYGLLLFRLFFPVGTPFAIVFLLILIEFISYFARMFSLAIRLFANITAGHILLKILSWFTYLLTDIFFVSILSFLLISVLWGLEFFIGVLQAYVFLILLCIYLQDILQLH